MAPMERILHSGKRPSGDDAIRTWKSPILSVVDIGDLIIALHSVLRKVQLVSSKHLAGIPTNCTLERLRYCLPGTYDITILLLLPAAFHSMSVLRVPDIASRCTHDELTHKHRIWSYNESS